MTSLTILLLLFASIPKVFSQYELVISSLTSNPSEIGTVDPDISFQIEGALGSFTIQANGLIQVTFPASYTTQATGSCSLFGTSLSGGRPCTFAGSVLTIQTQLASTTSFSTGITVFIDAGITFPSELNTGGSIDVEIQTSGGVTTLDAEPGISTLTLTSATMQSCQITQSTNDVVGSSTTLTFTLSTTNGIPTGGRIRLFTGNWDTTLADDFQKYHGRVSPGCTGVTNVPGIPSCTLDSSGYISFTNAFTSPVTGTIVFDISNMMTPLNTGPSNALSLQTYDQTTGGNVLETCSGMTFQVNTPGTITSWSMSCTNMQIGVTTDCTLQFRITNQLFPTGGFIIQVPPEMGVSGSTTNPNAIPGYFSQNNIPGINGNEIDLSSIVLAKVPRSQLVTLRFTQLTLPGSLAPTSSFQITSRSNGYSVDTVTTGFTFAATEGRPIIINSIIPVSYVAGALTSYAFDITLSSALTSTGGIFLQFPPEITLSGTCTVSGLFTFDGSTPSCTHDTTAKTILISGLIDTNLAANANVRFTVSGIQNPPTTEPLATTLRIQSLTNTANTLSAVDDNDDFVIDFITPGLIALGTVTMTPSPSTTSATATYTFQFTSANPVPSGGAIRLTYPQNTITFPFPSSTPIILTGVQNVDSGAAVTVDDVTSPTEVYVDITDAFASDFPGNTVFEFTLNPIRNFATTEPVTGFYLETRNTNDFVIDQQQSPRIITIASPHTFSQIDVIPTTLENGRTDTYQVEVTIRRDHYDGDIIIIEFPAELEVDLNTVTLGAGSVAGATIDSFSPSGNSVEIVLDVPAPPVVATSKFEFIIDSIKNIIVSDAIGQFEITSTDTNGFLRAQSQHTDINLITEPAIMAIPGTAVTPQNTILSETNVIYTFQLDIINAIGTSGYIEVNFPAEITAPSAPISCSNVAGAPGIGCTSPSASTIRVTSTGFLSTPPISFTIGGVTNPSVATSASFVISTFNAAGRTLDQRTTDLRFNADCDAPCKTCTAVRTECTSCFTDGSSVLQFLFGTTCVSVCPSGTTDVNFECEDCQSPCSECASGDITECTACETTPTAYYLEGTSCLLTCPATKYPEDATYTCEDCDPKCATCSDFDVCLTCPTGTKLWQNDCVATCPASISIDMGTYCRECLQPNCATCVTAHDNCLTCSSGYFLYGGNSCVDTCPDGLFYNTGSATCEGCVDPCNTCDTAADYCTSCNSGDGYAYNGVCVANCPGDTYPEVTGICEDCPTGCSLCSDSITCSACESGYSLFGSTCTNSCPVGTINNGTHCRSCQTGCTQCTTTISNCQSCDSGYYLSGSACVQNCPSGEYGDPSNECLDCHDSCGSCDGPSANDCTSCEDGALPFLTSASRCESTCPNGFYGDVGSNECESCDTACAQCTGPGSSQCQSCNTGYLLYQTTCASTCPASISVEVAEGCEPCAAPCATCSGTTNTCTSCNNGFYYIATTNDCVTECPDGRYLSDDECLRCTSPCLTCQGSADNCITCTSGLLQLNGECVSSCPSLTHTEDDGVCVSKSTSETVESLLSGNVAPFPFLISMMIILLFVVGSKASANETVISSNSLALLGFLEFVAWIVLTLLYVMKTSEEDNTLGEDRMDLMFMLVAICFNYICNIAHLIKAYLITKKDENFKRWISEKKNHKCISYFLLSISTLTAFKVYRLAYSRLLNKEYFSARMDSVKQLRPLHVITVVSLLTANFCAVLGSILLLQKGLNSDQLTITGIEIPILTAVIALFCVFDINKPKDYYDPQKSKKVADISASDPEKRSSKSGSQYSGYGNDKTPEKRSDDLFREDDPNRSNIKLLDDDDHSYNNEIKQSQPNMSRDVSHEDIVTNFIMNEQKKKGRSPNKTNDFEELIKDDLFRGDQSKRGPGRGDTLNGDAGIGGGDSLHRGGTSIPNRGNGMQDLDDDITGQGGLNQQSALRQRNPGTGRSGLIDNYPDNGGAGQDSNHHRGAFTRDDDEDNFPGATVIPIGQKNKKEDPNTGTNRIDKDRFRSPDHDHDDEILSDNEEIGGDGNRGQKNPNKSMEPVSRDHRNASGIEKKGSQNPSPQQNNDPFDDNNFGDTKTTDNKNPHLNGAAPFHPGLSKDEMQRKGSRYDPKDDLKSSMGSVMPDSRKGDSQSHFRNSKNSNEFDDPNSNPIKSSYDRRSQNSNIPKNNGLNGLEQEEGGPQSGDTHNSPEKMMNDTGDDIQLTDLDGNERFDSNPGSIKPHTNNRTQGFAENLNTNDNPLDKVRSNDFGDDNSNILIMGGAAGLAGKNTDKDEPDSKRASQRNTNKTHSTRNSQPGKPDPYEQQLLQERQNELDRREQEEKAKKAAEAEEKAQRDLQEEKNRRQELFGQEDEDDDRLFNDDYNNSRKQSQPGDINKNESMQNNNFFPSGPDSNRYPSNNQNQNSSSELLKNLDSKSGLPSKSGLLTDKSANQMFDIEDATDGDGYLGGASIGGGGHPNQIGSPDKSRNRRAKDPSISGDLLGDDPLGESQESYFSINDKGGFIHEDTPSNYNVMNQRFDEDEIARRKKMEKKSQFMTLVSDSVRNTINVGDTQQQKIVLPRLNNMGYPSDEGSNYSRIGRSRDMESDQKSRSKYKSVPRGSNAPYPHSSLGNVDSFKSGLNKGGAFNAFDYQDYSDFNEFETVSPNTKKRDNSVNLPNIHKGQKKY